MQVPPSVIAQPSVDTKAADAALSVDFSERKVVMTKHVKRCGHSMPGCGIQRGPQALSSCFWDAFLEV